MRNRIVWILTLLVALSAAVAAAPASGDPPVSLIPDNALWVLHMDMARFRQTRISDLVRDDRIPLFSVANALMKSQSRIDLFKDTSAITFFGMGGHRDNVLVCLDGTIDREYLITRLQQAEGYRRMTHGKYTVHRWNDTQFCVFVTDRLALYSIHPLGEEALTDVLDTLSGARKNIGRSPLMAQFKRMPAKAYLKAAAEKMSAFEHRGHGPKMLEKVGLALFVVMETGEDFQATLTLTAADPETARNIEQIVNGFIALARMNHEARERDLALLNGIRTTRDRHILEIALTYPVADLMTMLEGRRGLPFQKK